MVVPAVSRRGYPSRAMTTARTGVGHERAEAEMVTLRRSLIRMHSYTADTALASSPPGTWKSTQPWWQSRTRYQLPGNAGGIGADSK